MARIRLPDTTDSLRTSYKLSIPQLLQPRFTWKYCLASAAFLYISYCILAGTPFFSSKLPPYTGPHGVGAIDIEVPVRDPRNIHEAVFKDTGEPAFRLETVLFTLYYPTRKGARSTSNSRHHYWVPKPLWLTSVGYAKFARVSNFLTNNLFTGVMGILVGGTTIPAEVDVPLVSVDEHESQAQAHSLKYQQAVEIEGKERDESNGLPIIIFSHGMASSRTQYSHYLGELASRGYVCAAIEHRDGSGPGTQVIDSSKIPHKVIDRLHFGLSDVKSPPSRDNEPTDEIDKETFRSAQLAFREAEILETTHIVHTLNTLSGGAETFAANSRKEGSGVGLPTSLWEGRLNANFTILAGHSYGATGAMNALKPSSPFVGGIALDPGKSSGRLNNNITVPLLIVHSTSWSASTSIFYGRPHFDTVRDIARDINKRGKGAAAWFMTSLGTSHPSVTDAPLIEPLLLKWTTGAGIDAREGVGQYVGVSDEFGRFVRTGVKSGLLMERANSPDGYEKGKNEGMGQKWRRYWQVHVSPVG